jgi:hypothetical protein
MMVFVAFIMMIFHYGKMNKELEWKETIPIGKLLIVLELTILL